MFVIILVIIALDQLTKYLAEKYLKSRKSISIIPGVFSLTYVENKGAAFGILQNHRLILRISSFVFIILIIICLFIKPTLSFLAKIALCILLAGAIGNFLDRIFRGYVIDFLHIKVKKSLVFNIADIAIACGTLLLTIVILLEENN